MTWPRDSGPLFIYTRRRTEQRRPPMKLITQTTPMSHETSVARLRRHAVRGSNFRAVTANAVSVKAVTDMTKPVCAYLGTTIPNRHQVRRPPETPM